MPEAGQVWRQERPAWCPHPDCIFLRRVMDAACGGRLPEPQPHDSGDVPVNTHRFCLNGVDSTGDVVPVQLNASDLDWFRWVFDSLDGKQTSWLSRREGDDRRAQASSGAQRNTDPGAKT